MSRIDSLKEAKRGIGVPAHAASPHASRCEVEHCVTNASIGIWDTFLTLRVTLTNECANVSANLIECETPGS